MKRSQLSRPALALLALAAALLFALPATAEQPATAELTVDALARAVEVAKPPKCGPQEDEVLVSEPFFFQGQEACETLCDTLCANEGGYTLTAQFDPRGARCGCRCCVPR